MRDLTARQAAVFDFIRESFLERGRGPALREIMAHFGFRSTNGARDHVQRLVQKGFVRVAAGRHSAISLVAPVAMRPEFKAPSVPGPSGVARSEKGGRFFFIRPEKGDRGETIFPWTQTTEPA